MHGIIKPEAIDVVFSDLEARYRAQQLNSAAAMAEYLRHHGDDRSHADHNAEHGQERPQRVAPDGLQGELDGFEQHQAASLFSASDSTLPSTNRTMRLA